MAPPDMPRTVARFTNSRRLIRPSMTSRIDDATPILPARGSLLVHGGPPLPLNRRPGHFPLGRHDTRHDNRCQQSFVPRVATRRPTGLLDGQDRLAALVAAGDRAPDAAAQRVRRAGASDDGGLRAQGVAGQHGRGEPDGSPSRPTSRRSRSWPGRRQARQGPMTMAALSAPSTIGPPGGARGRSALPWTSLTLSVIQASQTCSASSMVRPPGWRSVVPGIASSRNQPRCAPGRAAGPSEPGKDAVRVVMGLAAHPVRVHEVPEPGRLRERLHPAPRPDDRLGQRVIHGMHARERDAPFDGRVREAPARRAPGRGRGGTCGARRPARRPAPGR